MYDHMVWGIWLRTIQIMSMGKNAAATSWIFYRHCPTDMIVHTSAFVTSGIFPKLVYVAEVLMVRKNRCHRNLHLIQSQNINEITHWGISRSSQYPTTGVTKAVVCVILSVG